jgi:hypothetical protein
VPIVWEDSAMTASHRRFALPLALLGLTWLGSTALAPACPFCQENAGPTLIGEFAQAEMVLYGTFQNPKVGGGGLELGTTDFKIEKVLKPNDIVKGKKVITIPRFVQGDNKKFLIFCDVYKKNIDAYKGVELSAKSDMVKYLEGGLQLAKETPGKRLRYCFDFLQNPELEISLDAYREFAKADYKDYKDMAKSLDPDILVKWLKSDETPAYRYGLYASLLGHCGTAEHAKFLRQMIDDPAKKESTGIDGLLFGYFQLDPKGAWDYLADIMKNSRDFNLRYAALRTFRFLYNERWDLKDMNEKKAKDELVKGVALILAHKDMADFGIEDLRRWKRWEMADTVLGLFNSPSHNVGTVKRAVLRYALRCPTEGAKAFVREQRQRDKEWVSDTEEILQLEDPMQLDEELSRDFDLDWLFDKLTADQPVPAKTSSFSVPQGYVLLSLTLVTVSCFMVGGLFRRGPRLG